MKEPEFYRKKLDNGITVLFENRQIPVVSVSSSVKFGAQFESNEIKGISHFIEHLVFKGTKNRNVLEIPKEIEDRGGVINAFTSEEITCFWNKLPSRHFALAADITRDLVTSPLFDAESLERERKVILEEIKMYHDNPQSYVLEKIKELMYDAPFGTSIAGDEKSVKGLKRNDVIDLFNTVYSTNNLIFSVVGKSDIDSVIEEAKKFPKKSFNIPPMDIKLRNGESIEKRKGIDQAHVTLGFHMPKLNDKLRYASEVFDSILGGGMSSKLFQEIREKRGLCYAIRSHLEQSRDYAYELVYIGTMKDKIDEVKKLAIKEIESVKSITQKELDEAKERLIGLRELSKEKSESTMIDLLNEEIAGDATNYYGYDEYVNKVKLEDVRSLANLKAVSFVALVPE